MSWDNVKFEREFCVRVKILCGFYRSQNCIDSRGIRRSTDGFLSETKNHTEIKVVSRERE